MEGVLLSMQRIFSPTGCMLTLRNCLRSGVAIAMSIRTASSRYYLSTSQAPTHCTYEWGLMLNIGNYLWYLTGPGRFDLKSSVWPGCFPRYKTSHKEPMSVHVLWVSIIVVTA